MATLYTHKTENVAKTWVLMSLFLIVVILLGWAISWYFQSPAILYVAVAFALLMNVWSYWYSDTLVIKLTGARPVSRSENQELWNVVENLSITAGLPMPKLYVVEDQALNAFATGRDAKHAALAVTSGLLAALDRSELEGVVSHELSHIGNRDMLVGTVAVVLVGFVAILSDMFMRSMLFGGGRRDNREGGGLMIVLAIAVAILAPLAATLIQLAISRKREFLADASGALLTRYPEGLASALGKISAYGKPMRKASTATAHLFISNPFGSKAGQGFARLFMTHPPVEERVSALLGR